MVISPHPPPHSIVVNSVFHEMLASHPQANTQRRRDIVVVTYRYKAVQRRGGGECRGKPFVGVALLQMTMRHRELDY